MSVLVLAPLVFKASLQGYRTSVKILKSIHRSLFIYAPPRIGNSFSVAAGCARYFCSTTNESTVSLPRCGPIPGNPSALL